MIPLAAGFKHEDRVWAEERGWGVNVREAPCPRAGASFGPEQLKYLRRHLRDPSVRQPKRLGKVLYTNKGVRG